MKKILTIFLLILLLIPFNAKAANTPLTNKKYKTKVIEINLSDVGVSTSMLKNSPSGMLSKEIFPLYQAMPEDNSYYHIYSLDPKNILAMDEGLRVNKTENIVSNENVSEMINLLLSSVYQVNKTNTEEIENLTVNAKLNIIATQILVWELSTGKRTSFESKRCTLSDYKNLISANNKNTISSGFQSLYDVYSGIIDRVKSKQQEQLKNSLENPFVLYYNVSNNRYQNILSSLDYNEMKQNYEIKNNTPVKLNTNSNGLLTYVNNNDFFTDVKSIDLIQKSGNTNKDLQDFYRFHTSGSNQKYFVLASKADKVPSKLYFKCAQGNFKIITLEGSGYTKSMLGSKYNIKDSNGNLLNFTRSGNTFTYASTNISGSSQDIVLENSNSYIINNISDGEYSIIQTEVPKGNSFSENEEDRTIKIKVENGNFYSYNKILKKFETNSMRIVKFTNYVSKVYIIDENNDLTYNLKNSNSETLNFSQDESFNGYILDSLGTPDLFIKNKKITIYGLDKGEYNISRSDNETRTVVINNNSTIGDSILISFNNKKNEINFYKLDEKGKYLEGGTFALRMINENNSESEEYIDVALKKNSEGNSYTVDEKGEEYTFSVEKGTANIKGVLSGKAYRIVELTPPEGYELNDANNSYVDIKIDSNGYPTSTPYIINKEIMITKDASSNAELILSIRTGKEIVKYGLIILGIVILLTGLIFLRKKLIRK